MHRCGTCSKQYPTKGSLHRHEQNHKQSQRFTCSTCQISFRRHDLLLRHGRIHTTQGSDKLVDRRRRVRTACNQCRAARVKCSGRMRCERCQDRSTDCSFSESGARTSISLQASLSNLPSPTSSVSDNPSDDYDNQIEDDQVPQPELQPIHPLPPTAVAPLHEPSADASLLCLTPDPTAWAWLHEDLFLQDDMNLDWFSIPAVADPPNDVVTLDSASYDHHFEPYHISPEHRLQGLLVEDRDLHNVPRSLVDRLVSSSSYSSQKDASGISLDIQRSSSFFSDLPSMSKQIKEVFELSPSRDVKNVSSVQIEQDSLNWFVHLYEKHFWPLWQFTHKHRFANHDFDPLLYLAMVSIGAMYGGRQASAFGNMLHVRLRVELVNPLLDINLPRKSLLPLGQARSLTQAAALYFGQKQAFSYAQHLGSTLVAQARKMNLFSRPTTETLTQLDDNHIFVESWIMRESRKRLAFAILRLEMYTSVLHSTRPLISGEELDLDLPCSHELWSTTFESEEGFAAAIRQETVVDSVRITYSDLIMIAADPMERLPHLKMLHLELLMYAMQEQVWTACIAKYSISRLTNRITSEHHLMVDTEFGRHGTNLCTTISSGLHECDQADKPLLSLDAHLAGGARVMRSLHYKIENTITTLAKLRREILDIRRLSTSASGMTQVDRSSLLSCLLIFHLAFIQLNAPLDSVHQICHTHRIPEPEDQDVDATHLRAWAKTRSASVAVNHAMNIFNLLRAETEKPNDSRANVNFLTMIGLYHSAVLIWTYGSYMRNQSLPLDINGVQNRRSSNENLSYSDLPTMAQFEKVFHDISPAWAGKSSFTSAIQKLREISPE